MRRSEKATHIVFAKTAKKNETNEFGGKTEVLLPVRRLYAVFNADQIDGYKPMPQSRVPPTTAYSMHPSRSRRD